MKTCNRTAQWFVWGFLTLVILAIGGLYFKTEFRQPTIPPERLRPYSTVPEFALTNQVGQPISLASLKGKVWIADIIFTRCGGPCPKMTARLAPLQAVWKNNPSVKLVTLTTDPEFDTPAVMKKYAEHFGADPEKWLFLTGLKSQIVNVAIQGLKLAAVEKTPAERDSENDLFIHTTVSVVVDKQGRVRGSFETMEPDFEGIVTAAVNQLLRE
jgi:protein SCO1/2